MHGLSVPVGKLGYQLSLPRTLTSGAMSRSETEPNTLEGQARAQVEGPLDSQQDLTRFGGPKGKFGGLKGKEPQCVPFPIVGSTIRNSPNHDSNEPSEGTETEMESAEFSRIATIV